MGKRVPPSFANQSPEIGSRRWRIRDIELDERRLELRIGGTEVRVEPKPLGIFMILLRNPDRVIGSQELRDTIWGGRPVTEQVIAQSVARLRRSLGASHVGLVRTLHGWGYRLSEAPEISKPPSPGSESALEVGGEHPGRRGWRLVEALSLDQASGWRIEHRRTGNHRLLLHLRGEAEILAAEREITQYNGTVKSGNVEGFLSHALEWNLEADRGFCFVEYPADLHGLPAWINSNGGFSAFTIAERIDLVARIAERVGHAHARGLRFGSLSPPAIVVGPQFREAPKFYLPAALHRIDALCARLYCGPWRGDPAFYIAPEVRMGNPVGVAADVFSIGIILLQVVAANWCLLPLPGWEAHVPGSDIRRLIAGMTHVDPSGRSTDLEELARALRRCVPPGSTPSLPSHHESRASHEDNV